MFVKNEQKEADNANCVEIMVTLYLLIGTYFGL